jgi:hypothetical protein
MHMIMKGLVIQQEPERHVHVMHVQALWYSHVQTHVLLAKVPARTEAPSWSWSCRSSRVEAVGATSVHVLIHSTPT